MKKLIVFLALASTVSFAVGVTTLGTDMGTLLELNHLTQPLSTSFAGANATFASGLTGKSNICLLNGGTTMVIGATSNSACGSGTVANFVIAANGGSTCLDRAKVKSYICLKLASYSNGVFATPW